MVDNELAAPVAMVLEVHVHHGDRQMVESNRRVGVRGAVVGVYMTRDGTHDFQIQVDPVETANPDLGVGAGQGHVTEDDGVAASARVDEAMMS